MVRFYGFSKVIYHILKSVHFLLLKSQLKFTYKGINWHIHKHILKVSHGYFTLLVHIVSECGEECFCGEEDECFFQFRSIRLGEWYWKSHVIYFT